MSQVPAPAPAKNKKTSLFILLGLLVVSGICAYAIPETLKQIYLAEEEAKRKVNIVGNDSGKDLPPGVTRPMPETRNVPGPGSRGRGPGGASPSVSGDSAPSDAATAAPAGDKPADEKPASDKPAEVKPADDKPAEVKPSEPAPTEPAPAQPEPTAPANETPEKP